MNLLNETSTELLSRFRKEGKLSITVGVCEMSCCAYMCCSLKPKELVLEEKNKVSLIC